MENMWASDMRAIVRLCCWSSAYPAQLGKLSWSGPATRQEIEWFRQGHGMPTCEKLESRRSEQVHEKEGNAYLHTRSSWQHLSRYHIQQRARSHGRGNRRERRLSRSLGRLSKVSA
ncbi:hypothetical protein DOTSEDRAFT_161518 [Dothistroma septosporum NZE10]|uniref:Uncharacterized protein n=1 Tax=Dothistroma septosporum (strain NZE10 / CBS 128990) TaxID=675120 RepID=N1PBZ5_DOTSN|nr:hypothetical protein DOTSEDRAFT_161518 [Dothistroma septosporum NZE10]